MGLRLLSVIILSVVLSACGQKFAEVESHNSKEQQVMHPYDVNKHALNKLVCDPFTNEPVEELESGVKAQLYYRGAGQSRWYDVQSYIDQGVKSSASMFFSQINVPTRLFTAGFPLETGGVVKNNDGQDLVEYFALDFTGRLRLAPEDEEGVYELALLSDDGTIWSMNTMGEGMVTVVANDGDHPTRFGCGTTVTMTRQSLMDFQIKYYQGPRYHISVIPMWRKVTATTVSPDPQCGQLGNSMYFDFNNNSTPQAAYQGLLARGWKPLKSGNYVLPKEEEANPCYQGEPVKISNMVVESDFDGGVFVIWNTDVPATSQVLIKDLNTGVETLTTSDNVLRTQHSVRILTLTSGHSYEFRAVSITATMGKAVSAPITMAVP